MLYAVVHAGRIGNTELQLEAYAYGYKWRSGENTRILHVTSEVLAFDTDNLRITKSDYEKDLPSRSKRVSIGHMIKIIRSNGGYKSFLDYKDKEHAN